MGYESNEASVFTNISSDHLDLQGIHTLPELAEVKSTVCRVTKPDGWTVLNADDPFVAAVARRVHCRVAYFSMDPDASPLIARHRRAGGRSFVLRRGRLLEWDGADEHELLDVADLPVALGGLARHNVANALAAAGGARALGATREQVAEGCATSARPRTCSPGRLNLFQLGKRTVIVDFAHNEAGHRARSWTSRQGSRAGQPAARRRSPRSSARPATGPTTRSAASAGSRRARAAGRDQGDARLPPRPDARERHRHDPRRRRRGRHGPGDRPDLRGRGRRARGASSSGLAPRAPAAGVRTAHAS